MPFTDLPPDHTIPQRTLLVEGCDGGGSSYPLTTTPGGAAGGDLSGTYPNPTIADAAVTVEKISGDGGGEGNVPTVQSDGSVAWQPPSASPQLMTFHGGNTVAPAAGARYFTAGASSGFTNSTSAVRRAKVAMRISDLAIRIAFDMPTGDWAVIDLMVNGFPTTFITLAAGATAGIYQSTSGEHFDLSAGDEWYWRLYKDDSSSAGEDSAPIGPGDFLITPL